MDRWIGKIAVVTGASSGIGAAVTEALVRKGLLVVGIARRVERLEKLSASLDGAKGKFYPRKCDVGKEEDLLSAFEWVKTELGGIDILVNNAGVVKHCKVMDDNIDSYRNMVNVNFMATVIGMHEAVASMQHRKVSGHIVNVNSVLGHSIADLPMPVSVYPSTKYAITALSEVTRKELAADNVRIKVTSVSPGFVSTEIFETGGLSDTEKLFQRTPHLQPKDVADAIVYVLGTPENVQISELTIRPICYMDRWVGKIALVTGASVGIGAATVEALVREGLKVVGIARRVENIEKLREELKDEKGELYARKCDVSKEEEILAVFEWIEENLGGVDVLVNNAGLMHAASLTDGDTEGFRRLLDVNVLAVALCTREAVRQMKARHVDGHIFNINSILGHYIFNPFDTYSLYPSSKFAVTAMTEVVRKELITANTKIKITSISPGLVGTELFSAYEGKPDTDLMKLQVMPKLNSEDVANAILYALGTPPHVQVCELILRPVGEVL
nr:dehydrogenase/reductase SDR family member 11-like [Neodiprion pinetum]